MNYKVISFVLAVAVIVLSYMAFTKTQTVTRTLPSQTKQTATQQVPTPQFTDLADKVPTGFPAEFVLPKGATEVKNSTVNIPGVRLDLNEQFSTTQSLSQVATYYQKIFKANGWQSQTLADDTKTKAFAVTKGDLTGGLFISIDSNRTVQVRLVVSQPDPSVKTAK